MSNTIHDISDMADEVRDGQDEWWPAFEPEVSAPNHERVVIADDGYYGIDGEGGRCALWAAALVIFSVAACAEGIVGLVL